MYSQQPARMVRRGDRPASVAVRNCSCRLEACDRHGHRASMTTDDTTWKRCSTCKKPIAFAAAYYACSVSTCNRRGALFAFCSVDCWDAHVPVMRHRDAWANEATAPTAAEWAREQEQALSRGREHEHEGREPRRIVVGNALGAADAAAQRGGAAPRDVLIVVSKLKHYIRATS